jgi:mannose-6-phosphate isomerase-like protein (cupin superfamily)
MNYTEKRREIVEEIRKQIQSLDVLNGMRFAIDITSMPENEWFSTPGAPGLMDKKILERPDVFVMEWHAVESGEMSGGKPHRHDMWCEVRTVVDGDVEYLIEGGSVKVGRGGTIKVPAMQPHVFRYSEGARGLVTYIRYGTCCKGSCLHKVEAVSGAA